MPRNHTLMSSIRNTAENNVSGLRYYELPPETYRKYIVMPDGTEIYIGEFPVPTPDDLKVSISNSIRENINNKKGRRNDAKETDYNQ